jgi:formylglycine-generating enzyme required for sulfatase activity
MDQRLLPPDPVERFPEPFPPPFAEAWGDDDFGLWAEFEVAAGSGVVVQRLRWIEPGTFLMGSPNDEPERFDDEGPRHAVTLTRGLWLADTACTQALWRAVTGADPSRFKGDERPVEGVSWHDVRAFLRKLEVLLPGALADLPTEAEWEYACRAGTTTAIYAGELKILGVNNAPALDPIAWYGGNSGVDFELDDGIDSSGWKEKQYEHNRAGTHPVKRKAPNLWGLYDMLGNVWEWCADGLRTYDKEPQVDPREPEGEEAHRVYRGGSWDGYAGWVRSAVRYAIPPGYAYGYLGFRLCLRSIEPGQGRPGGTA